MTKTNKQASIPLIRDKRFLMTSFYISVSSFAHPWHLFFNHTILSIIISSSFKSVVDSSIWDTLLTILHLNNSYLSSWLISENISPQKSFQLWSWAKCSFFFFFIPEYRLHTIYHKILRVTIFTSAFFTRFFDMCLILLLEQR